MALALNNLQRVDMPLNKETKPYHHIFPKYEIKRDSMTGVRTCLLRGHTSELLTLLYDNPLFIIKFKKKTLFPRPYDNHQRLWI